MVLRQRGSLQWVWAGFWAHGASLPVTTVGPRWQLWDCLSSSAGHILCRLLTQRHQADRKPAKLPLTLREVTVARWPDIQAQGTLHVKLTQARPRGSLQWGGVQGQTPPAGKAPRAAVAQVAALCLCAFRQPCRRALRATSQMAQAALRTEVRDPSVTSSKPTCEPGQQASPALFLPGACAQSLTWALALSFRPHAWSAGTQLIPRGAHLSTACVPPLFPRMC